MDWDACARIESGDTLPGDEAVVQRLVSADVDDAFWETEIRVRQVTEGYDYARPSAAGAANGSPRSPGSIRPMNYSGPSRYGLTNCRPISYPRPKPATPACRPWFASPMTEASCCAPRHRNPTSSGR
jgi:hypothetical protein